MKIAILSREPKSYSTRRLKQAAVERGHQAQILDTMRFGIYVEEQAPDLTYRSKNLGRFDAVIPRIGASVTFFGTAVVRQFEQMGVFSLNSSIAINVSRDKLRSLQVLSRHDIAIPPSAFVRSKDDVLPAIERVGGAPVIIKLLEGTQGVGVILAESIDIAKAIIETLQNARQNILIQKFVAESKGRDIRALVVGDRVVAAMRRRALGQEFRSNVHRGGVTEAVCLEEAYERAAVKAAHIMGLRVAGVDMLETREGPVVMEVNSSPGFEALEAVSGEDVAGSIVELIEGQVHFNDVDLRQRLTLARGYTVAELPVHGQSPLAGKTLQEAGLREMDILVLSITRRGLVLPVPNKNSEILPDDILLCYGKQLTLKTLLPPARPRRRRKRKLVEKK